MIWLSLLMMIKMEKNYRILVIQGDIKDLGELKDITDWNEIAKLHGTNDAKLGPDHIRGLLISKSAVKDILLLNEINQSQVLNYIGLSFY